MFLNEVMEETRKICNSENWPIWATPENLPFFEDEIYPLFSYSYGSKVPKWKCAHNLLCKKYKNCSKLLKIAGLQPLDLIQRKKNTLYILTWICWRVCIPHKLRPNNTQKHCMCLLYCTTLHYIIMNRFSRVLFELKALFKSISLITS